MVSAWSGGNTGARPRTHGGVFLTPGMANGEPCSRLRSRVTTVGMNLRKLIARVGVACLVATLWAAPASASVEPERTYIVVLHGDARVPGFDGSVEHVYSSVLHGFSARLTPAAASALARRSGVDAVVPDTPVHAMGEQLNPPSWGLDRIDQRD